MKEKFRFVCLLSGLGFLEEPSLDSGWVEDGSALRLWTLGRADILGLRAGIISNCACKLQLEQQIKTEQNELPLMKALQRMVDFKINTINL